MAKLDYEEIDVQEVMKLTGKDYAKSEKYLLEVAKDLDTDNVFDVIDVIESEVKDKERRRLYAKNEDAEKKDRKPKEKKVDEEKAEILTAIRDLLIEKGYNDAVVTNADKLIDFKDGEMTLMLTRHRKKK